MKKLLVDGLGLHLDEFRGKTAVVTGAGQGIGLRTASAFAALGGRVIIAEWDEASGKAAEQSIRASGGMADFIHTDVSNEESVAGLRSAAGGVDVLVNNAIRCPVVSAVDMDVADWDAVIGVNLRGTFLTCKAFLPAMLRQGSGVILNMISTEAMPGLSAYIASKQGILGLSQSLALETGENGVKIVPFAPGMVDTPGIRSVSGELAPRLGISQEQFLHLSLHASYEGLMPAEHAGAAAAYLALRLAGEFHGQSVTGYEVLERAGFLKKTTVPNGEDGKSMSGNAEIQDVIQALKRIIDETGQEFEQLPVFVRPIARGGFKSKSGMSLGDWGRMLDTIGGGARPSGLRSSLEKLAAYYANVPGETARFTRDRETLAQIAKTCQERIQWIRLMQASLDKTDLALDRSTKPMSPGSDPNRGFRYG